MDFRGDEHVNSSNADCIIAFNTRTSSEEIGRIITNGPAKWRSDCIVEAERVGQRSNTAGTINSATSQSDCFAERAVSDGEVLSESANSGGSESDIESVVGNNVAASGNGCSCCEVDAIGRNFERSSYA